MNIPELPDSDETIALKELIEQLKYSNEIALNSGTINVELLNQITEMNEKLTSTEKKLDNIWNRLSGVGNLVWILLLLLGVMWMLVAIYERMGNMRLY